MGYHGPDDKLLLLIRKNQRCGKGINFMADTVEIFSKCGKENCFGRTIVEEITGLKPSGASKLIKLLVDSEVIVPVTGHGKGKYRFQ